MGTIEKQCVICGKSCAGQPRIKDNQGRYIHKACTKKTPAKAPVPAEPEVEQINLGQDDDLEMATFLEDLPSTSDTDQAACPSCGQPMIAGTLICVSCGYNTQTGKGKKTKSIKAQKLKQGSNLGVQAGKLAMAPFLPIIGAVIGGAVGAAVWAAVAHFTGYEIGILASGVGAVCGIGAVIGAGGNGTVWSGSVAVIVALLSIIAGKAIVNSIYVERLQELQMQIQAGIDSDYTVDDVTDEDALWSLADIIITERVDSGKSVKWPDPRMTIEEAEWPNDYSERIIQLTQKRWNAMDEDEQLALRQTRVDEFRKAAGEFNNLIDEEMEISTNFMDNLSIYDGLWAFLALGAAWQIGYGGTED